MRILAVTALLCAAFPAVASATELSIRGTWHVEYPPHDGDPAGTIPWDVWAEFELDENGVLIDAPDGEFPGWMLWQSLTMGSTLDEFIRYTDRTRTSFDCPDDTPSYPLCRDPGDPRFLEGYFNSPTDYRFAGTLVLDEYITPGDVEITPEGITLVDYRYDRTRTGETDLTFSVPEPSGVFLMMVGLLMIVRRREHLDAGHEE